MTALGWERGGIALALYFVAVAAGRLRAGRKQQAALKMPLADAAVLEAVFHPRLQDGDDTALLMELREKFVALNRQADAAEFFALHIEIATLSYTLAPSQSATLRRAVLRLLTSNDCSLQCVGAQTAADLQLAEAIPSIMALLSEDALDSRSRKALEEALARLSGTEIATG